MDDVSTTDAPPPTQIVVKPRARHALGDMGRSLGLMVVVVAALMLLGPARTLIFPGDAEWKAVDYTGTLTGFQRLTGTPPLRPTGLPSSWRANASTLRHTASADVLHVGWAVPGSHFAGLDEGVGPEQPLLDDSLGRAGRSVRGAATIDGERWDVRRSGRGETALTRQIGTVLVIVTGDATDAQLRVLAASLR